ncbi:MAG: protein kinase domain-containing protein, partial [Bdellovibrionales bacterium]
VFRAITEEQVEGRDVLIPIRGKAIKVFSEFSVDDSESMAKFKTVLNSYTALAAVKPALRLKLFPQIYVVTRDSTGVLKAQKWIPDSNVNLTPENMIVVSELGKKSLADWLAKDAGSDPELRIREAHEVFDGILAELVRLARAGFVHGDIKPSNVVLGYDGGVHLVDFGGAAPPLSLPSSRTMGYTAPEIVYAGSPMSVLTDLYSLGATVLKVLDPQIKPQVNYSILGSVQEKLNDIDSQVRSLQ